MITITESAKKYLEELCLQKKLGKNAGIAISVVKGGCSGLQYKFDFAHEPNPTDSIVDFSQFKIFIDQKALLFVIGTQLDYLKTETSAKLIFNNPNAKHECGCGKSFNTIEKGPELEDILGSLKTSSKYGCL